MFGWIKCRKFALQRFNSEFVLKKAFGTRHRNEKLTLNHTICAFYKASILTAERLLEINFTEEHIKARQRRERDYCVRACPCALLMESGMDSAWAPPGPVLFLGVQCYRWQHADTWAPGHSDCAVFLCFTSGAAEIDLPQPQGGSQPASLGPAETKGDTWTMLLQRSLKMPSSKEWRSSELLLWTRVMPCSPLTWRSDLLSFIETHLSFLTSDLLLYTIFILQIFVQSVGYDHLMYGMATQFERKSNCKIIISY